MATLAYLRTVVDRLGKSTGEFECSACAQKFQANANHGAVETAFMRHRLENHPLAEHMAALPAPRNPADSR